MKRRITHDVLVIGAGAAGLTAAGGCARLGLRVALVERGRLGGECLHTGCVPSKALLAAARRAQAMRATAMGVAGHEPSVDFAAVMRHVHGAIEAIAPHDSAARFEAWGVEIVRGEARLTGRHSIEVADRPLSAPRIVIATGSEPVIPPIPGLADASFLTNETVFELAALPAHLLVLGGGPNGVEMAQAFRRLGAGVSLVANGALLPRLDADAVALVRDRLVGEGVRLFEQTHLVRITRTPSGVEAARADAPPIEASHLLVAAGRKPRLRSLDLDAAGVASGADGIIVDRRCRTSNKAIYAIGDCRAGPRFTHAAGDEGTRVVASIGFGLAARTKANLPAVTYTQPELAQLGLTEAQARQRHRDIHVMVTSFADNDRAVTEGDTSGFIKLVRHGRRIVGVTIVGEGAGDLLLPWSMVMAGKASLWSLSGAIVPYPTRSELSKAAAFATFEPALFGAAARAWARSLARFRLATLALSWGFAPDPTKGGRLLKP